MHACILLFCELPMKYIFHILKLHSFVTFIEGHFLHNLEVVKLAARNNLSNFWLLLIRYIFILQHKLLCPECLVHETIDKIPQVAQHSPQLVNTNCIVMQ